MEWLDSSIYSNELCNLIERLYSDDPEKYTKSPKDLLIDSVVINNEQGKSIHETKPIIYASVIGDSSYMILRQIKNCSSTYLKVFFESN